MSTGGTPLPLDLAQRIAARIVEQIQPYCARVEIAGSMRRGRPVVNDIDLVCLPLDPVALRARILRQLPVVFIDGPQQLEVAIPTQHGDVRLDFWFASQPERDLFKGEQPSNFGSLLLCRTGSTAHNIRLVERARALGLRWNPYWGVYRGDTLLACATEEQIFAALDLPFISPEQRQ